MEALHLYKRPTQIWLTASLLYGLFIRFADCGECETPRVPGSVTDTVSAIYFIIYGLCILWARIIHQLEKHRDASLKDLD